MKKLLLDVIFASEKRNRVILLLQKGPLEMKVLLRELDTTRQALLPQIRILEDHHLVAGSNDSYELTAIGRLIADKMGPLLGTLAVLDNDVDYWGKHWIDFIPAHLLERISDIRGCSIVQPSLMNLYEMNMDFIESAKRSGSLFFISSFMQPNFSQILRQFVENNIDVSIIVNRELLDKMKRESHVSFNKFISTGRVRFYLYPGEFKFLSLSLSDDCAVLRLFTIGGGFSNKQLVCCTPEARGWNKDLFDHYLKDSIPITD
ncbi:helix-turn-helix transcriptional regulator [Methanolobus chelungpuianus]|uniref:Transcriptional regulator n=1 Tax=Methanolobus chelungpuianus TaxID=502115 RepID=A0AAE3HAK5_9EURY|nr:winged helix-turn-helix domain-containing protein [Methanolobus chelungpuianus]MCQ6963030.1 transcriptional regulator [Methanolobus chelungpuianus]